MALALRAGEIKTFEEAAERVVEKSLFDAMFKLVMAFYRRFMLLSMGSTKATMFAVIVASIEEVSICAGWHGKSVIIDRDREPTSETTSSNSTP